MPANNLPLPLSSFFGREHEIDELKRLLASARLVTLTGAGGCGKTRLALEVARHLSGLYADDVWLVSLAALADGALVSQAIASALGVREQPSQPLLESLTHYLYDKQLLLLLDNCEHLIEACAHICDTLLRACPHLHLLATSREALNIEGETTFLVPSLSSPPKDTTTIDQLTQYEAVRLFVARASAVQSQFVLTNNNASAVAHILNQLDGIPLAVELAAARVTAMSVEQMAPRLSDSIALLTGGSRVALPRQQTMRATLDWSYDLLSESERLLFRRLSVFAGGWTLEAAEAVCGRSNVQTFERFDVLDLLTQLVNKSLVVAETRDGKVRYRMLEPIRQYAREKLEAAAEVEVTYSQHLDFFLALADEARPFLRSAERNLWLNRLESEYENIRTALRWAMTHNDSERGLKLAGSLHWFWRFCNHETDGRGWYASVIELGRGQQPSLARARVLCGAGFLAWVQHDLKAAQPLLEEALHMARTLGDKQILADALAFLGVVYLRLREYTQARSLELEAEALCREIGDMGALGNILFFLGWIAREQSDYDSARAYDEASASIFRSLGDAWYLALPRSHLGLVAMLQGDFLTARDRFEERVAINRQMGDKWALSAALHFLGDALRGLGDYERAEASYQESLKLKLEIGGDLEAVGELLNNLGRIARMKGELFRAADFHYRSLKLRRQIGDVQALAHSIDAIAAFAAATASPAIAVRLFGAVEGHVGSTGFVGQHVDQLEHERGIAAAQARLDKSTFDAALAQGRALTLEQAIALAQQIITFTAAQPTVQPADQPSHPYPAGLTEREVEVLRWLAQGLSDAEIAEQLAVSKRTVHAHLRSVYGKLDVTTRSAATRAAIELKLV